MTKRIYTLAVAILALATPTLRAANYWVSTDGNNSSAGTSPGTAWLTIQKAADTMVAGDTVFVTSGDYTNTVTTTANGSSGSFITFQGTNSGGGIPRIPKDGIHSIAIQHDWIRVRGFSLGDVSFAITSADCLMESNHIQNLGMYWYDQPNNPQRITIRSNQFVNPSYNCLGLQGTGHIVTNNHFEITSSVVYDADVDGDMVVFHASNSQFVGNYITNWTKPPTGVPHTDLIQAFSISGEISTNNIIGGNFFDMRGTVGVQFGNLEDHGSEGRIANWKWINNIWIGVPAQMSLTTPEMLFANNLFYQCGAESSRVLLFRSNSVAGGTARDCKVFNNLWLETGYGNGTNEFSTGSWGFVDSPANFQSGGNLFYGSGATPTKDASAYTNGLSGDPLFVSAAALNFHILTNSPAIGAATNLNSYFTTDFDSVTRGSSWDIGPFEFAGDVGGGGGSSRAFSSQIGGRSTIRGRVIIQ